MNFLLRYARQPFQETHLLCTNMSRDNKHQRVSMITRKLFTIHFISYPRARWKKYDVWAIYPLFQNWLRLGFTKNNITKYIDILFNRKRAAVGVTRLVMIITFTLNMLSRAVLLRAQWLLRQVHLARWIRTEDANWFPCGTPVAWGLGWTLFRSLRNHCETISGR